MCYASTRIERIVFAHHTISIITILVSCHLLAFVLLQITFPQGNLAVAPHHTILIAFCRVIGNKHTIGTTLGTGNNISFLVAFVGIIFSEVRVIGRKYSQIDRFLPCIEIGVNRLLADSFQHRITHQTEIRNQCVLDIALRIVKHGTELHTSADDISHVQLCCIASCHTSEP